MQNTFQGVCSYGNQYRAQIFRAGRVFYLGLLETPEEAAQVYDRAVVLTRPWTKKKASYNFEPPKVTRNDPSLTKYETEMLTWLRTMLPDLEAEYQHYTDSFESMPGVALGECRALSNRFHSMGEQLEKTVHRVTSALQKAMNDALEKDAMIDFLRRRVTELEQQAEVYKMRADPADPKSIFKRVVPPAALPTPEALTPESVTP